jgi:uncharacterized protein YbbC (DUF1343 family)
MTFSYKNKKFIGSCLVLLFLFDRIQGQKTITIKEFSSVVCGNERFDKYLSILKNKRVCIITNVTGVIQLWAKDFDILKPAGKVSLVDTLLKLKINIKKIFGPEHGFRSDIDAGEKVSSNIDTKTGLRVISLYGSNKKPTKEQLADVDIVVYDIQDIGVRFYTYISTMSYAMEACAESDKEMIVLDRPNPNGFYIDGPVLKNEFRSFLGLHNVPLVYGMTCGEYAKMANEEGWLKNKVKCKLTVVPLKNYERSCSYNLTVNPSPNIPNSKAVLLYPSLGLFEGTIVSLGRGTDVPFQVIGHPEYPDTSFCFVPRETIISKTPKYLNRKCCGLDLRKESYINLREVKLDWLKQMFVKLKKDDFFDKNFNFHSGNSELQEQIKSGMSVENIRKTWQADLEAFKKIRKKYLLYPEF